MCPCRSDHLSSLHQIYSFLGCGHNDNQTYRNNLEVLKINNNSFKDKGDKDYKGRIIAFLKDLKYLDYELIEQKEREKAD